MIPETPAIRNNRLKTLILLALVVLVGVASFGLGRLSASPGGVASITIHQPGEAK